MRIDLKKVSINSDDNALVPVVIDKNKKRMLIPIDDDIKFFTLPSVIDRSQGYIGCFLEEKKKLIYLESSNEKKLNLYIISDNYKKEITHEYLIDNESIKWSANDCQSGYFISKNGRVWFCIN